MPINCQFQALFTLFTGRDVVIDSHNPSIKTVETLMQRNLTNLMTFHSTSVRYDWRLQTGSMDGDPRIYGKRLSMTNFSLHERQAKIQLIASSSTVKFMHRKEGIS
jgi:hypothetical protein